MTIDSRFEISDPIQHYPKFAQALGMIVSQAALLEMQFARLLTQVKGSDPEIDLARKWHDPTLGRLINEVISASDQTVPAIKARIDEIIMRAQEFNKFRNRCAHDLWQRRDEGGSPLIRITYNPLRDESEERITIKRKEMFDRVKLAKSLNADLAKLIDDIDGGYGYFDEMGSTSTF